MDFTNLFKEFLDTQGCYYGVNVGELLKILVQHRGKKNPVTSADMGKALDVSPVAVRMAIHKIVTVYALPVISSPRGYYVPANIHEVHEYIKREEKRQKTAAANVNSAKIAVNLWFGGDWNA